MSTNYDVIVFFWLMANIQLSGSRIPDAWSIKRTFSLINKHYLNKRTEHSSDFLQKKNADISKMNGVLVLKGTFSETTYVCAVTS